MPNSQLSDNDFIAKLTEIVEANITNPQFGVSMLAKELGMSRSNLHRKVNEVTKITVSQFINQIRLKKAREILRHTTNTVSEVAYEVGFSNVSYFIKRFHEFYGYSPGEVGNHEERTEELNQLRQRKIKLRTVVISLISVVLIVVVIIFVFKPFKFQQNKLEKTIAILPAQNWETSDSIVINGILQNVEINLCKINEIIVVPWLSGLQYRNSLKPAPDIAKELGANYLVKPRVWRSNGKTYLSITLIEGKRDKTLGIYPYEIDSNNITTVHQQILKDIADEIDISITPIEQDKISKLITANKSALSYYWIGTDFMNLWRLNRRLENLDSAMLYFKKALEYDNECSSAYAQLATIYYYKDKAGPDPKFSTSGDEKTFSKKINKYADKALFYDDKLDLSMIAKALYYQNEEEYEIAVTYLEKALEYNPRSILAIQRIRWIYYHVFGDLEKSLNYALLAMKLKISVSDTTFYNQDLATNYYYLATSFRALGFFDEAVFYIDKSLEIEPNNVNAGISRIEILIDKDNDYEGAQESYLNLIKLDTTNNLESKRLLAVSFYKMRDWESALKYYQELLRAIDNQNIEYSGNMSGRLAVIYSKLGDTEKEQEHIKRFLDFLKNRENRSYTNYRDIIGGYSLIGESEKAMEQLKILVRLKTNYATIRNLKDDPILDKIREIPEFDKLISDMETRFWQNHERIKKELEKEGLLNLSI